MGIAESIEGLDPRCGAAGATALILGQIFESAATLFEPLRSEDEAGTFFSAAMQPEVRFSDGTLLTPEIAAVSLRGAKALAGKGTIDAHDGRVWFHLSAPNPRFAMTLARAACAIALDRGNQLHGTGPFMFDQRPNLRMLQLSPSIRLVRNPYYRAVTAIQEIRFTIMPPDADGVPRKLLHALRQEWIDLTTALDPSTSQAARTASIVKAGNSTAMLFFNTARRPMNDLRLRRGIAATLDRNAIATACYERNAASFVASSVLPLSMTPAPRPRIEIARRPLVDPGSRLTLLVPPSPRPFLPRPVAVANEIQGQLAHAGVSVVILEARNETEYTATLHNRTFDMALGGCIAESSDPDEFLDAVLALCDVEPCDDALQRIEEEMLCTPLVYGHATVMHARHLRDVSIAPDGFLALANVKIEAD